MRRRELPSRLVRTRAFVVNLSDSPGLLHQFTDTGRRALLADTLMRTRATQRVHALTDPRLRLAWDQPTLIGVDVHLHTFPGLERVGGVCITWTQDRRELRLLQKQRRNIAKGELGKV